MMLKRLMSFILGCIVLLAFGRAAAGEGPGEALSRYITAYLNGNYEEAYRCLAAEDRQAKSLEAYLAEKADPGTFLARNLHRLIRYDIQEVTLTDDRHAFGKVNITVPDFSAIVGDVSYELQGAAFPEGALDHVSYLRSSVGIFERKYQAGGVPGVVYQETFDLVREGDQWKVRAKSWPRRK